MIPCGTTSVTQHFVGPDDPGNKLFVGPLILDKEHLIVTVLNPDGTTFNFTEGQFNDYTVQDIGTDFTECQILLTTVAEDKIRLNGVYGSTLGASVITINRNMCAEQTADYIENNSFPAETHELRLDYLTLLIQQVERFSNFLAIRFPATDLTRDIDPINGLNNVVPSVANRANQFLKFDGLGNVVVGTPVNLNAMIVNDPTMGGGGGSTTDAPSVAAVFTYVQNETDAAFNDEMVNRSTINTIEDFFPQWDANVGVLKNGKAWYVGLTAALDNDNGTGVLDSLTIATFLNSLIVSVGLNPDGTFDDPSTGTGEFQCACFRSEDANAIQTIIPIEPAFTTNNPSWPTPGFTFQIEFDGVQTIVLQSDEDFATIKAAIEAIPALTGNVTITGAGDPLWSPGGLEVLTIEFINTLANQIIEPFVIVNETREPSGPVTLTLPTFVIATTQVGHKTTLVEAFCCLHDEVDQIEDSVGLEPDGTWVNPATASEGSCSAFFGATNITQALCMISDELDEVEGALCLNPNGTWDDSVYSGSNFLAGATSLCTALNVLDAKDKELEDELADVVDDVILRASSLHTVPERSATGSSITTITYTLANNIADISKIDVIVSILVAGASILTKVHCSFLNIGGTYSYVLHADMEDGASGANPACSRQEVATTATFLTPISNGVDPSVLPSIAISGTSLTVDVTFGSSTTYVVVASAIAY